MRRPRLIVVLLLILGCILLGPSFCAMGVAYVLKWRMAAALAQNQKDYDALTAQDRNPAPAPKRKEPAVLPKKTTGAGDAGGRVNAVERIKDQDALAKIAVHDPSAAVRKAAVRRMPISRQADPVLLERLMLVSDDERVRDAANARLPATRQAQFDRLMAEDSGSATLAQKAVSHPDPVIRHAAVARLQDPAALARVAAEARDPGVRRAAAARIPMSAVRVPLLRRLSEETPETGQEMSVPLGNLTTVALLWVPPTSGRGFSMGSPEDEEGRDRREKRHTVVLTRGFWLGKTEVTVDQWCAVMERYCARKFADLPVSHVSWDEAMEFCRKLTETERAARRLPDGYEYTLPTDAQWEYACRAGTTGIYAGDLDAMAWYGMGEQGRAHAVGTKLPNAWGFYDMHGNLWEWCRDWGDEHPGVDAVDPSGPATGTYRLYRGGCWWFDASACRSANWGGERPGEANGRLGFRVALAPLPGLAPAPERQPDDRAGKPEARLISSVKITLEARPADALAGTGAAAPEPVLTVVATTHGGASASGPWSGGPPAGVQRNGEVATVNIGGNTRVALCWIGPTASGGFMMGSPEGDPHREDDQKQHAVVLTKGFWLGQTEVTQAQWKTVMGNSPSVFEGDDLPVENVSWDDAMAFCRKLTERERAAGRLSQTYEYILPTEAQWEYACRSTTGGDTAGVLGDMAWYERNADGRTRPVGTRKPNFWGLFDMHGNVAEWCRDWYGEYPGGIATDPAGPSSGSRRVCRGGNWRFGAKSCFSANRGEMPPLFRDGALGLRVALVPADTDR